MSNDSRQYAARFYDIAPIMPDDVDFYVEQLQPDGKAILELGCGTGRVLLPLVQAGARMTGVDRSEGMLAECRKKLADADIGPDRAVIVCDDITEVRLDRRFDRIIAPFRVLQNLETDEQVDAFFDVIRRHLADDGRCVLNVFNPRYDRPTLADRWKRIDGTFDWEIETPTGRVTCIEDWWKPTVWDGDRFVMYVRQTYKRTVDGRETDAAMHDFVMRVYYPEVFDALIRSHGFHVRERWGGYRGEMYGEDNELVIEFAHGH